VKQSTLDILRCPLDKAELDLDVEEQDGEEILDGTLTCTDCGETYEIDEGIANLLPPDMREEAPS